MCASPWGASSEESADIIYQSTEGGRSYAASGKVYLYRQSTEESRHNTTGITIAHELGHSILGLGDSYREDARFGTGCGVGPGFDVVSPFGSDFNLSPVNNTLMQQAHFNGSACTFNGKAPSEYDPYFDNKYCATNADCSSFFLESDPNLVTSTELFTCQEVPEENSEFSVSANFDLLQGSGVTSCPPPEPGRVVVLDARLSPVQKSNLPELGEGGRTCGDGVIDSHEMCDTVNLGGALCVSMGFAGGTLSCNNNCTINTSACLPLASCGDGVRDTSLGEECEPGEDFSVNPLPTCIDLGLDPASVTPPTCQSNCGIDWSMCGGNRSTEMNFNGLTVDQAVALADFSKKMSFIDALGDVGNQYEPGPSLHELRVFFERLSAAVWRVHFAVPGDDYEGGTDGVLMLVHQVDLTFSNGRVSKVAGQASSFSEFRVGGPETGAFRNSPAAASQLQVQYAELEMIEWTNKSGSPAYAGGRSAWGPLAGVWGGEPDPNLPGTFLPITQRGQCNDDLWCSLLWNESTKSYEGTSHFRSHHGADDAPVKISEWERAVNVLNAQGFPLTLPETGFPLATPADNCNDPVNYDTSAISPDPYEVALLVLDRSGSMTAVTDVLGGQGRTRLEYMKNAASTFVYLQGGSSATKTGLITFASDVTPVVGLSKIGYNCGGSTPDDCGDRCVDFDQDFANCGACGNVCGAGQLCDRGSCSTACGGAGLSNCNQICVDLKSDPEDCGSCNNACVGATPVCDAGSCVAASATLPAPAGPVITDEQFYDRIDPIVADGQTALGPALRHAAQMLSSTVGHRAVMLMSDGEANLGEAPSPVIDELTASGVEFYFVPASDEARAALAGGVKTSSGGDKGSEIFDGGSGETLPAAFFEGYARSRAESLTLDRTASAVQGPEEIIRQVGEIDPDLLPPLGAGSGASSYPEQESFDVVVEAEAERLNVLVSNMSAGDINWDPGLRLLDPSGNVVLNQNSPEVHVGELVRMLRVDDPAPGIWTLEILGSGRSVESSLVQAHIESVHPDCRVQLSAYSAGPAATIDVSAHAYWNNNYLATGVQYTALVHQPDGSVTPLVLTPSLDPLLGARGSFTTGGNTGLHRVSVSCDVGEKAAFAFGEAMGAAVQADAALPALQHAEPFHRVGVKNVYVHDAADSLECQQQPTSLACCSQLGACPGTQDTAVVVGVPTGGSSGSWSGLILSDRAAIRGPNGSPTQVVSISSLQAQLGADAIITGDTYSVADVFARERSQVQGSLQTAGQLIKQNQSQQIVSGTLLEGAALVLPSTALQLPQFPATNRGDVHLEPQTTRSVRPGAYNHVMVKSRATLRLQAGNYWFESFSIEPQAQVITSGTGATRIYVKSSPQFKESVTHATGLAQNILIFSTGSQDIFVEKAFQGTLIAPFAGVVLGGQDTTVHRGAIFARGLELRAGVTLEHLPFAWTWVAGGVPIVANYTRRSLPLGGAAARAAVGNTPRQAEHEPALTASSEQEPGSEEGGCSYVRSPSSPQPYWLLLSVGGAAAWLVRRRPRQAA